MARGITDRLKKWAPNEALRNFRKARQLSQAKLGKLVGFSQSRIHRLETGESRITPEVAMALAPPLGRPARDLIPLGDEKDDDIASAIPETDRELLARGMAVGNRFAPDDRLLAAEIAGLVYALLVRERQGHPISDDERTLSSIDDFLRVLRHRGPL